MERETETFAAHAERETETFEQRIASKIHSLESRITALEAHNIILQICVERLQIFALSYSKSKE